MPPIRNPILPGFNPDPSILRVGDDYFIATSTFEWYPGVQIHHSKDLANWTLITRPLSRASQLDMRGDPDSCGVWAPCLTHDGTSFYLVYTDVRRKDGSFKDSHNYIVTAPEIIGPWSDPIHVNSSGFDPSLFHDPDTGKKWFVNMLWDHRSRRRTFAGILLQEYCSQKKRLVGPKKNIFKGTELDLVEGPHLYKRGDYYYLLTAEGGTAYEHACTLCRSRNVWGPYEVHPNKHIVTAKDSPFNALQRTGHGDLVDTLDGRTYLVHLMGRPTTQKRRCVLGRETAIQECEWREDGWLYLKGRCYTGNFSSPALPTLWVDVPGVRNDSIYWTEKHYDFTSAPFVGSSNTSLPLDFQWLRTPYPERIFSLANGKGLKLFGRESIGSWNEQALVARRQTHFSYAASTVISFDPEDERQFAGLVAYYCRYNFFYLCVTAATSDDDEENICEGEPAEINKKERVFRELIIMSSDESWPEGDLSFPGDGNKTPLVRLPPKGKVRLALKVCGRNLQFSWAMEGEGELKPIGPVLDASILSDECGGHKTHGSFTGTFVGMACSDLNGTAKTAVFDHFTYKPLRDQSDRYEI